MVEMLRLPVLGHLEFDPHVSRVPLRRDTHGRTALLAGYPRPLSSIHNFVSTAVKQVTALGGTPKSRQHGGSAPGNEKPEAIHSRTDRATSVFKDADRS